MRITVATIDDAADVLTLEIAADLSIQDLKAVIESESNFGITAVDMILMHDGRPLQSNTHTLAQCNIKNDDVLTCQRRRAMTTTELGGAGQPTEALMREFQRIFQALRSDAGMRERIRRSNPEIVRAVETNNIEAFLAGMLRQQQGQRPAFAPTDDDLLDPQIQRRIEEEITMENVRDNMEHAYEYAPEFFGHVVMLYINCKVNGHSVKAFVDSGAQMTIMSKACAERCGIMRLIDRRFSGIARGVGTQEILGRIHLAQLEVEKQFFAISLSVLGDQSMDMLIGLDMLRRHRCVIDLEKNVLRIEDVVETSFLPESELPDHAKLSNDPSSPAPNDPKQIHTESATVTARRIYSRTNSNSSTTSISSPTTSQPPSLPSPFPENTIRDIMKKGFTREEVIQELRIHQGDPMKTTVSLMTKSLSKPRSKK